MPPSGPRPRIALFALLLWSCSTSSSTPNDHPTDAGPTADRHVADGPPTFVDGPPSDPGGCKENTKKIFALDVSGALYRFDPPAKTFTLVGTIDCGITARTWSMSVTHEGTAHVLYDDGSIFAVSTEDASCTPTSYQGGQLGFQTFGMGYSSDAETTDDETLYIASASALGRIDKNWTVTSIGAIDGAPELTGNAVGGLWGFFPKGSVGHPVPHVSRLDKNTAALSETIAIDAIAGWAGNYAFAHWGGDVYVFYGKSSLSASNVYRVDLATGVTEDWILGTGKHILGAGVSTCAPVVVL